ncbi:MAG: hypothetical protein FIB06_14405 [Betaproteobacteria bacterium]|nr:hypothetical protein [Betaproteobacteria bacterium]
MAQGDHEAADYSGGLLESAGFLLFVAMRRASALIIPVVLLLAQPAAAASEAAADPLAWGPRLARAAELQREGTARRTEAEATFVREKEGCYRKFLVNRCLDRAHADNVAAVNSARLMENEGKALERQVKKEQMSERELRYAAEEEQRAADLRTRETQTAAARQAAAAEEAATRADKERKAEEGAARRAADAERQRKKREDHDRRVAEKMEKAAAKPDQPAKPASP